MSFGSAEPVSMRGDWRDSEPTDAEWLEALAGDPEDDRPIWLTDADTAQFLYAIVDHIPAAVFVKDARTLRYLLVNKAAEDQMRCSRADLIGHRNDELLPAEEAAAFDAIDHDVLRTGYRHVGEEAFGVGSARRLMRTSTIAVTEHGEARYLIGICEDITERRANEDRIAHLAHHDALTDLPNRVVLLDRLDEALAARDRHDELVGLLCIDLDHFKDVNDGLGHSAGDALLREMARRLRECARTQDLVTRHGGDEFTVLQSRIASPDEARQLADRIIRTLSEPFRIHEQDVAVGASVGIAVAPQDGVTGEQLLRHADMALYRAKADGRSAARFFEPEMDARLQTRRALERDLRAAFADGGLELHYQPLTRASDGAITGFEALLRWPHPERGDIPPAEFIPVAEEIGLIGPLTEWVLGMACREAASWPIGVGVAVNLSAASFRKRNPAIAVARALGDSGLDPARLEIEITESVLLNDSAANIAILHEIRDLGVRIVMDDFGTGYSSLSYLRSFPFDKIKIDRSFIREIGESPQCAAIVRAVMTLSESLGVTTTAEGVETVEQYERLRAEGCHELQGFLFGRPAPAAQARLMLAGQPAPRRRRDWTGRSVAA